MPEYLSPGVYIEESSSGPRPIEGVGTTTAAFVGFAPTGPANTPVFIANWQQYVETFGSLRPDGSRDPHLAGTYLSHAVYGYFNNGGTRCFVTRIAPPAHDTASRTVDAPVTLQLPTRASRAVPALTLGTRGAPAGDIVVDVQPPTAAEGATSPAEGTFTLRVRLGTTEETYENVSVAKKHPRNVVETVNAASTLIEITEQTTSGSLAERVPEHGSFVLYAAPSHAAELQVRSDDFIGSATQRSGIDGLEVAEDVAMLCVPDLMSAYEHGLIDREGVKAVQLAMINHCERTGNRMALLDPLPDLSPQDVRRWREQETAYDSAFAALYYPWLRVGGPDGRPIQVPPCGHIAGIYARSDVERGVHKAPANEIVRGALDPALQLTRSEQDILNPGGVNCIRAFTGQGVRVWGARTLASDARWRYVSVRRLFSFVEQSIERGTQWAVFEPNDTMLWSRIRRDITAFLTGVWREGALFGQTASDAFYVKCDAELNPPEIRDRGLLIIEVGLAPVKPAEFVVFRFSQYAGGGQ
jgi:phage tail sheath protein FI